MSRYGITLPLDGVSLPDHRELVRELADLGYTDVWSSETDGTDAFTPLAVTACWAPAVRLGTAIASAFTRGPALLAMTVAAMAELAPGRFAIGIGASSDVIVEQWNGIRFTDPYRRVRDVLRFLRAALTGEKVDFVSHSFVVKGFRLGRPPAVPPPILVAALRPRMVRLGGEEGDGIIINWLATEDVPRVVAQLPEGTEVVARLFVCPTEDREVVRRVGRFTINTYLNVPVYASFHRWLGRGPLLEPMWNAWQSGDRQAALEAVPDEVLDALVIHGSSGSCRQQVQQYVTAGVTTPLLHVLPFDGDPRQAVRDLAVQG
jgi:probable F420-dependent oxidoreductase